MKYESGIWEQDRGLVVWSKHRTQAAAEKAARRYARERQEHGPATGGALSWSGGWRSVGGKTTWVRHDGSDPFEGADCLK